MSLGTVSRDRKQTLDAPKRTAKKQQRSAHKFSSTALFKVGGGDGRGASNAKPITSIIGVCLKANLYTKANNANTLITGKNPPLHLRTKK